MATPQELLAAGIDPVSVQTLQRDQAILAERENAAALDKIAPVISEAEATAELDSIAPIISEDEALDAIAPKVDPLDIFSDEALIADKEFSPKEHYIAKGGATAFDAKSAARLGKIRKGQEASRSTVGTVAAQLGTIIPAVPRVIAGVGKGIASGLHAAVVNPLLQASALVGVDKNFLAEYEKLSEQQAAEGLSGAVAETAGLVKGVKSLGKYVSRKTGISKSWKDMTDDEAFRAIIDEGESEREVRSMAQGDIPALAPIREELAAQGTPVRPEKVQEATERGLVGWLGFGTGIKLGGAAASAGLRGVSKLVPDSVLSAAQKAEQLAALRVAKDAALKAQQAGPKNAATEAALRTAQENFQAAETAVGESNVASAIDLTNRARSAISSASTTAVQGVLGRPIQAAGAAAEGIAKAAQRLPRGLSYLGAIGGLFVNPAAAIGGILAKEVAAPLVQRAGAAVKGYGKSVAEGQARRTLDVLGAAGDVATTSLSQFPMDYAFSVGLSDTEQEARVSAPISTALGVGPGVGRGVRRIVTGELITPKGTPAFKASPAYGENKVLDTAHATAMKTVDAKTSAQVNWVRELARKMGGRVYLMPDTATFESTLTEVYKQQNPGAEITPAVIAKIKQMADQQGLAFGEFLAADGEAQPTVFIKNAEAAVHEMGHIMEKVVPESVNTRLDDQILARLSPESLEAAGTYYARRLGRTEPWREVLSELNPELTPEQYLARELRTENLGVALKNRGEAFATSPGIYRWLAQTVAKIGDIQGIPLAQSEALGFPVFGDVMAKGEKAIREALGDEAGQELIQARDARLRTTPETPESAPTSVPAESRAEEGAKGEALAAELDARNPAQAEVLRKISSAISSGQGLKVDYRTAPGEPAGSPASSRDQRRAVREAFRDMPESVRPLWEKLNFPDRVEATKNKGFQIVGWSPENFAANAAKMARFIAEVSPKAPEAKNWSQYEIDPATKSFIPAGWKKLYEDVQTFVANQQAGGTGSGRPLQLPANAAELNISVPRLQEGSLKPLNQAAADFINILFNLSIPETPRISRKGGTPGNIVAQDIARANEPLVGPRVVEPGRARSEAEFKGFAGRKIQEVNPLRARMEKAASDAGVSFPSLIETSQRLNLDHVADVTAAPEALPVRGVTDTLRAGFLPAEIAGKPASEIAERILKSSAQEFIDLTTSYKGEKYGGGQTGLSIDIGRSLKTAEDLQAYRQAAAEIPALSAAAKANKDIDTMFSLPYRTQFFREILEAATEGSTTSEYIKKHYDPNYKAPFPKEGVLSEGEAQFLPKFSLKSEDKGKFAEDAGFGNFWLSPDGLFYSAGDHGAWAKARLSYAEGEKPLQKSYEAERALIDRGWIRISREREAGGQPAVFLNGKSLSPKQESAVELWAKENPEIEVVDTKQLRGRDNAAQFLPRQKEESYSEMLNRVERTYNENLNDPNKTYYNYKRTEAEKTVPEAAPITTQALPKRAKDETKLLPAGAAGVSKAWILPGGKIEQLGPQWHHDWLDQNKEVQKKYGLEVPAFEGGDAEAVRESALKKGFVRINYGRNTGTLTVEARAKDWRKQKAAVEKIIEKNLDDIDNVTVHLLDENVQKVVDSASERLFNYDENVEKMANLPFITKGEVRGQFLPKQEASEEIRGLARSYSESAGIDYTPRTTFATVNESLAKKLADYYDAAESNPTDAAVRRSYEALADETLAQYQAIEAAGYTIEPWTGKGEPYKNSEEAVKDVRDNKHLWFLKTEGNFKGEQANPLLADSGIVINEQPLLVNDVFRAVHDFFGHAKEGYQFGPRGEFNAWNAHSEMFSPEAQGALAAETLAQNSWVNYGPHLRNEAGSIPKKGEPGYRGLTERPFAEQKNILVPAELIAEAKAQFLPEEQTGLPGISSGREFDRKAIEGMSQAQLKDYFPEAIIPKKNTEFISDNIVGSPLAKAAGSKEAAVQAFADKLVREYRAREDDPMVKAGEKWYSEFTPLLKKEFGKDSRIFAELLAATSPNNPPATNFAFALDALRNWKAGRYDKMISKFNEGLDKLKDGGLEKVYQRDLKAGKVKEPPEKPSEATYLAHWIDKNNLIPLGSSGKRFSMHSVPVLKVLARKWLKLNSGLKTDNFIKNLVGEGDEATIDLWASRSLRRLGYEGFQPRWRILPRNKTGVSDEDFVFSQQVFRKAADELGIKPSALQGGMWYAEKKLWSENGWGRLDLGDYKTEMERMPQLRSGFKSREALAKAEAKAEAATQNELDIVPR